MEYRNNIPDELRITSSSYQTRAEKVVRHFLKAFPPSTKTHGLDLRGTNSTPFSIRLNENPPSVQIRRFPKGGMTAGIQRIHEKLVRQQIEKTLHLRADDTADMTLFSNFADTEELLDRLEKMITDATSPLDRIVVATQQDLTYECIVLTLMDPSLQTILAEGLMDPQQIIRLLEALRDAHPDNFLIVKRYIMGIERDNRQQVPFGVVESDEDPTFNYLEQLPDNLI